jgi:hypothetical protein
VFVIGPEDLRLAIAHVRDFKARRLQARHKTGGAQSFRRAFMARRKSRSAGRRANQGNLLRLPDNLYRQRILLPDKNNRARTEHLDVTKISRPNPLAAAV